MVGLTESMIYAWVGRSRIEYRDLYMRLYVAYNAWYQKVTNKQNGYEAISALKTRFVIWDGYQKGISMKELQDVMFRIVLYTRHTPLNVQTPHWKGSVKDIHDWEGLIHFWYEVRCQLFHGAAYTDIKSHEVQLAYESLYIFMNEIVRRMKLSFTAGDTERLEELRVLVKHDVEKQQRYIAESITLHQKFIHSPDLWAVDMQRISS